MKCNVRKCGLCNVMYGMVWYGMVWYGMAWCGVVWYGVVCMHVCLCVVILRVYIGAFSKVLKRLSTSSWKNKKWVCTRDQMPFLHLERVQALQRRAHALSKLRRALFVIVMHLFTRMLTYLYVHLHVIYIYTCTHVRGSHVMQVAKTTRTHTYSFLAIIDSLIHPYR